MGIMVKITDKKGNLRGYLTPDQFKEYFNIPKSSTRFLPELLKEYSEKHIECNFSTDLK